MQLKVNGLETRIVKAQDEYETQIALLKAGLSEETSNGPLKESSSPKQKFSVRILKPHVVVDAVMAKRNLGTRKDEAPLVIGIGPGFTAPDDVHIAVESNRGHDLGRIIFEGRPEPYTGIPGQVMAYAKERVLRAPVAGRVKHMRVLGDNVKTGDYLLTVDDAPLLAPIDGVLRGLIREISVVKDEKVGDIDPRGKLEYCYTISDKARAAAGGVLEAIMHVYNRPVM